MVKLIATHMSTGDVVLSHEGLFVRIDTDKKDVVSTSGSFTTKNSNEWVESGNAEPVLPLWEELAAAATASFYVDNKNEVLHPDKKIFRVPKNVQQESMFFGAETVSLQDIYTFTNSGSSGGLLTHSWVNRVMSTHPQRVSSGSEMFYTYFSTDEPHIVTSFVKNEGGSWFNKNEGSWVAIDNPSLDNLVDITDDYDLIDILSKNFTGQFLDLSEFFVEEFGIFNAAYSELDLELIDRAFDVYDTQERSVNAKKQVRGPGGRFIKNAKNEESTKKYPVARLTQDIPLLEDPAKRIDEYLEWAKKRRGELAQSAESAGVQTTDITPLYLAIVDDIDTDAVLDLISLVPPKSGTEGDVTAWRREGGQWVSAPEYVDQLRGSTPPSVKEITDVDLLSNVIDQIDKATEKTEKKPEQDYVETETTEEGDPVDAVASMRDIALGLSFSDGSLLIKNGEQLREAVKDASSYTERLHVIKRARALNRLDLIPEHWGATDTSGTPTDFALWGPYGEIIPLTAAGGLDRNRGNADRLRRYWTVGVGGQKIRWNTPGDWYRCVSFLSKHLGPRARGYCNLRHKEMTGMYPGDKKNKI